MKNQQSAVLITTEAVIFGCILLNAALIISGSMFLDQLVWQTESQSANPIRHERPKAGAQEPDWLASRETSPDCRVVRASEPSTNQDGGFLHICY